MGRRPGLNSHRGCPGSLDASTGHCSLILGRSLTYCRATWETCMVNLRKLEPVAFVLLFVVLYYALVALAPHSALHDSVAETLAGGAAVAVAVALLALRRLPKRRWSLERSIYAVFLAAMPCIYLAAALQRGSSSDVAIEVVGVVVFVGLALFGYYKSFLVLGLGIAAHGLGWDVWHHGSGSYIASWYPLACLLVDLALGLLVLTQASVHQMPNKAFQANR